MKLIDLLVKELPRRGGWPKGSYHAWCDRDGEIRFRNGGCKPDFYPLASVDPEFRIPSTHHEDDGQYIVTKPQYESALAASEGWIEWAGGECPVKSDSIVDVRFRAGVEEKEMPAIGWHWKHSDCHSDIIAYRLHKQDSVTTQHPVWNGEGLPPVGCECERSWAGDKWVQCKVLFVSDEHAVVKLATREAAYHIDDIKFRPLRTEAEKARDEAVKSMASVIDYRNGCSSKPMAGWLYDAIAAGKIPGIKLEAK